MSSLVCHSPIQLYFPQTTWYCINFTLEHTC